MIICHKYKFIFIKAMKVAGSSIERAITPFLSDGDIIFPMEENRMELKLTGPSPQKRWGLSNIRNLKIRHHAPLAQIIPHLRSDVLDYTVFSIERSPWDRA